MTSTNKSFLSSGKNPGIEIWRIESFEAVPLDKKNYGTFFAGDSYLILETSKNKYGRMEWKLFFWLGKDSTQDEKGTAAYKAVELDDVHMGKPVQYREVMGHESDEFQAVFKKSGGVRICNGGIDSGFNKVDPNAYEPRLFQCKGKRNVLVSQVEMKSSAMNHGDVFILDDGLQIYRWLGAKSNKYEKFKSMEVCAKIKDEERGGKAKVIQLDSTNDEGADAKEFWAKLGSKSAVKSAADGGSDSKARKKPTLIKISDESGKMEFDEVKVTTKSGRLKKESLKTEDVFLVDVGYKVYVWVGKGATKAEKKESIKFATSYLESKKYPEWIQVERINEWAEPPAFKDLFFQWNPPKSRKIAEGKSAPAAEKPKDIAAEALFKVCKEAEEKMVDSANGKVTQWRIENLKRAAVPAGMKGQFFDGDSYIVLYEYMNRNKPSYIIYFWQGNKSSTDEKAASALLTRQLDDDLKGAPVQVRVTQNHEPKHFMAIFGGKMIIRKGGHASAFKNRNDKDKYDTDGTEMYHVKAMGGSHTRTIQCEEEATALNSGDCFVLLTPKKMYIWEGSGASSEERKSAIAVSDILKGSRPVETFDEGKEPEDFWTAIGGKKEYTKTKFLAEDSREPRLFHLSGNTGALHAEEIYNFSQDDLINDDVMMLDLYNEVYVWVGADAQAEEVNSSLKLALEYAKSNPDGRESCSVYQIQAGYEPPSFTAHFIAWDLELSDSWIKGKKKEGKQAPAASAVSSDDVGFLDWTTNTFPLANLQGSNFPPRVNPAKKELYLEDKVFVELFKVSKAKWNTFKEWKKRAAKQKHNLF